jgi:carbon storage regulator CsrA
MLVLSRKKDQRILLKIPGREDVRITVTKIDNRNRVRLGIEADPDIIVVREELDKPTQPSSKQSVKSE